ncbi:MAG: regulatory protein GemA [Phenylobacterium sp.]|nr:regulatory protein GemA [Phenylobacterium sp.]
MTALRKPTSADRRAMLAKVHLAAKDLGLDDDARRDVIQRVTGHRSSADCTDAQLDQVIAEFRRLGFQAKPVRRPASPASSPFHGKAKAMWASLYNLGAVRNGSDRALEAFGKRQLGVDSLRWADQSQGYRLVEALKAMAERAGWSQDLAGIAPAKQVLTLKRRLVQRQAELMGVAPFRLHDMTERELDRLAAENGKAIRAGGSGD